MVLLIVSIYKVAQTLIDIILDGAESGNKIIGTLVRGPGPAIPTLAAVFEATT